MIAVLRARILCTRQGNRCVMNAVVGQRSWKGGESKSAGMDLQHGTMLIHEAVLMLLVSCSVRTPNVDRGCVCMLRLIERIATESDTFTSRGRQDDHP